MKQVVGRSILIYCCLVGLSGCGRIIDWAKGSFYQGENLKESNVPQRYLRTVTVHDQLMTTAIFDALWLSNELKIAYTNTYVLKFGKNEERRKAFLRRQLEENRHFISFYVLSAYKNPLGTPESVWAVFLRVDGVDISPIEVKAIDLDPIYKAFFGKRFNMFKEAYRVKFEALDDQDNPLINENTQRLELVFRSVNKETSLLWSTVLPGDGSRVMVGESTECEATQECAS